MSTNYSVVLAFNIVWLKQLNNVNISGENWNCWLNQCCPTVLEVRTWIQKQLQLFLVIFFEILMMDFMVIVWHDFWSKNHWQNKNSYKTNTRKNCIWHGLYVWHCIHCIFHHFDILFILLFATIMLIETYTSIVRICTLTYSRNLPKNDACWLKRIKEEVIYWSKEEKAFPFRYF